MDNKSENIGLRLLSANTESVVEQIIRNDKEMSDDRNWYPVDGRDTTIGIISNQASDGGKAATELITNMVDAMLTKRCLEEGIDPKSAQAPKTMYEAVDRFITKLNGGKILKADSSWLKNYSSKNLVIGVTGLSGGNVRPCYTFCDNGEGQRPEDFVNTFLSLSAKNKSQIPFVQGKYNMGSSGVLNFCGRRWFKLIISRRYNEESPWGWTLIRQNSPQDGMPFAEYFAPAQNIETVGNESIFPFNIKGGETFKNFSLTTGTIIKLYEYNTGRGHSFRMTREVFNENLVETILPFRIFDFRQTPSTSRGGSRALGVDERAFYGMEFLLASSHADPDMDDSEIESQDNKILPIGTEQDPELGEITVTAIVLKKKSQSTGWIKQTTSRIFHHVNGQVQYKQMRGFLTQCKLPALKDRIVIFVDASYLSDRAQKGVWKADRQSILDNDFGAHYKSTVKSIIAGSPMLKKLNYQIAQEELNVVAKDSSRALIKELADNDENFALLLDGKTPDIPAPTSPPVPPQPRGDLKHSPTYIKFKARQQTIELPINHTRPIPCITDACDDFLIRSNNRGSWQFSDDAVAENFTVKWTGNNGDYVFFLRPGVNINVGDTFRFKIGLVDDTMIQPVFTEEVELIIKPTARRVSPPKPPTPPVPPPPLPSLGIPPHKLLTSDGREFNNEETVKWEDSDFADFGKSDGGYVKDTGEGKVYYINYDNEWFKNYLHAQKNEADKSAVAEKYILSMRILMLGLEHALSSASNSMKELDDEFRRLAAKGAATVALTICDQIPQKFDLFRDNEGSDE